MKIGLFWIFFSLMLSALVYVGIQNTNRDLISLTKESTYLSDTSSSTEARSFINQQPTRERNVFFEIGTTESEEIIVTSPTPLVHYGAPPEINLTSEGIFRWTNYYRELEGLSPLRRSELLDSAAIIKVRDMFQDQYFEHVSPGGVHMGMLIENVGYEYITVGENLAMGIFQDEKALVDAWMASPGHRDNILKKNFEEIGISVWRDTYNGETIWMSVQEFARPASACMSPPSESKRIIQSNIEKIDVLSLQADDIRNELDKSANNPEEYNKKVGAYNEIVHQINPLVELTQGLIENYNKQVNQYNACVKGT